MNAQRPGVGIGVLILDNNKILLGKRINAHGHNSWAPPGGHLEFMESPEDCARREVLEETGLIIDILHPILVTNDFYIKENKHYITIFLAALSYAGVPMVLEPEKCLQWEWFEWNALPSPLFLSFENFLKEIKKSSNDICNLEKEIISKINHLSCY